VSRPNAIDLIERYLKGSLKIEILISVFFFIALLK
jgi:hypothetical protein